MTTDTILPSRGWIAKAIAAGLPWSFVIAMGPRWKWALAFALGMLLPVTAQAGVCADPGSNKTSAVVNIGTNATTLIADAVASQRIYLCALSASLAGGSVTFKYGTKVTTDCDTGAVTISGVILPATGKIVEMGYGDDLLVIPPGNQLCGTTSASGSFQGSAVFVQK